MKIISEHVYPPIPIRTMDWVVYDDDKLCCDQCHLIQGRGATRDEAFVDFTEQWLDE